MNESGIDLGFDLQSQDNFKIDDSLESGEFYKLKSRTLEEISVR